MNFKTLFNKGKKIPEEFKLGFVGDEAYLNFLTDSSKELVNNVANVTFGKGVRNIWHSHPGGQILIVTDGEGYYQEKGKEKQLIKAGNVITIGKDVIHWHGATENSEMAHLVVTGDPRAEVVIWKPELEIENN